MYLRSLHILCILALPVFCISGCRDREKPPPPRLNNTHSHSHPEKKESTLVVPDSVKGAWKSVRIAIVDKSKGKEHIYNVPVGGAFTVPDSSLKIEVETFLPAFVMQGSVMTSSSNELKNPGAKVKISTKESVIFKGWLFSRYPTAHAFMNPSYNFTLIDAIPAKK